MPTFLDAEAFIDHLDMTMNLWKCANVGPAIICFLESEDYVDCIKLAISLGGDADTLAAIAGPVLPLVTAGWEVLNEDVPILTHPHV